jgi:hypothetical protein
MAALAAGAPRARREFGITGVLLHFALRTQAIDTTVRLGYLIGLTGLLLFLVGLVIVF